MPQARRDLQKLHRKPATGARAEGSSTLLPSRFPVGTFGHVVLSAGLSFSELARGSRLSHTTIMRWAWAAEDGHAPRIRMRHPRERVQLVFDRLNEAVHGQQHYTPEFFQFYWPRTVAGADPEADAAVHSLYERIMESVRSADDDKSKYRAIAEAGRRVRTAFERVAWARAWRVVSSYLFHGNKDAHLQPPAGCDWYAA